MKNFSSIATVIIMSLILFGGCAKKPDMYSWGDYTDSLYRLKKEPNASNLAKHKEVLNEIFENSKDYNLRVPPGIYCEYGFLLLKEGKAKEANQYFDLEQKTYPESMVFIQRLKSYIDRPIDKPADKPVNKPAEKPKELR